MCEVLRRFSGSAHRTSATSSNPAPEAAGHRGTASPERPCSGERRAGHAPPPPPRAHATRGIEKDSGVSSLGRPQQGQVEGRQVAQAARDSAPKAALKALRWTTLVATGAKSREDAPRLFEGPEPIRDPGPPRPVSPTENTKNAPVAPMFAQLRFTSADFGAKSDRNPVSPEFGQLPSTAWVTSERDGVKLTPACKVPPQTSRRWSSSRRSSRRAPRRPRSCCPPGPPRADRNSRPSLRRSASPPCSLASGPSSPRPRPPCPPPGPRLARVCGFWPRGEKDFYARAARELPLQTELFGCRG